MRTTSSVLITVYRPEYVQYAAFLCQENMTDGRQMARYLNQRCRRGTQVKAPESPAHHSIFFTYEDPALHSQLRRRQSISHVRLSVPISSHMIHGAPASLFLGRQTGPNRTEASHFCNDMCPTRS
jgi:hypothetical protein